MSTEKNKNNSLPSPVDFFLKTPLYEVFHAEAVDEFQIQDLKIQDVKNFQGTIDAFCMECKKDSIFRRVEINQGEYEEYEDYPRTSHDLRYFVFLLFAQEMKAIICISILWRITTLS